MTRSRLAHALFWAYAMLLSGLLLAPGSTMEQAALVDDKLAHLLAFALFGVLAVPISESRRSYLAVCAGIALFGGAMEIAQIAVPGRDVSWLDALANTAGITVAAALMQSRFHRV